MIPHMLLEGSKLYMYSVNTIFYYYSVCIMYFVCDSSFFVYFNDIILKRQKLTHHHDFPHEARLVQLDSDSSFVASLNSINA